MHLISEAGLDYSNTHVISHRYQLHLTIIAICVHEYPDTLIAMIVERLDYMDCFVVGSKKQNLSHDDVIK